MRKKQSLPGRMATTGLMLLFLVVLVLGMMRLPQAYGDYSDRRTLNCPEYVENDVKVYAYDYTSMEEKLQDIVYYQSRSIELQDVYIPAAGDMEVSDGELTGYLQQEIDQLYQLGILYEEIDLSEYSLNYRELCNIYPGNGDRLKGRISYWLLSYENVERSLIVQMDTEYHKLYRITLDGMDASIECQAMREYLSDEILSMGKTGREVALALMDSLLESYARYYGITVPEDLEGTGVETENPKEVKEHEAAFANSGKNINGSIAQKGQMNKYVDHTAENSTYAVDVEDTGAYREKRAEALGAEVENVAWMIQEGAWEWGFSIADSLVIKEDGSSLNFWGNYQCGLGAASFSAGIQWEI